MITEEQAVGLRGWVGLRNVLAHLYTEIDVDRLHAVMREDKHLLREFGRIAAKEQRSDDS